MAIAVEDIASAFFTTTPDLTAEFPALAARQIGWTNIALMGAQEMAVPGSLQLCLRVLVHEIGHVFGLVDADGAWLLRPRDDRDWRLLLPDGHSDAWRVGSV